MKALVVGVAASCAGLRTFDDCVIGEEECGIGAGDCARDEDDCDFDEFDCGLEEGAVVFFWVTFPGKSSGENLFKVLTNLIIITVQKKDTPSTTTLYSINRLFKALFK